MEDRPNASLADDVGPASSSDEYPWTRDIQGCLWFRTEDSFFLMESEPLTDRHLPRWLNAISEDPGLSTRTSCSPRLFLSTAKTITGKLSLCVFPVEQIKLAERSDLLHY